MITRYSFPQRRRWLAPLTALALAGCQNETVPGPETGLDYFPLEVGRYRTYAVVDTLWRNFQPTRSTFQFRETITDQLTDAAGQPAYRVVRATRQRPTDAWRDDSVLVLTPRPGALLLTRNNRPTVELVFPVRESKAWNMYAFTVVDTVASTKGEDNRQYQAIGQPFQATADGRTFAYEKTLTTALIVDNSNTYGFDNEYFRSTYQQVYAQGIGPVYRVRRRFNYCDEQAPGGCSRSNTRIYRGLARVETLIESGKR